MGTDISLFAEKRVERVWQPVPQPRFDRSLERLAPAEAFEIGRPYGLFSLLSGGPVGLRSGLVQMPAIFPPRGLPQDMNPLYQEFLPTWYDEEGGVGGASWLEVQALVSLDWEQKLRHHAFVEGRFADLFHEEASFPRAFPEDGMLFHGLFGPPPMGTCRVSWSITLREYVGCSDWFLEQLATLGAQEDVRIIYWFDS